MYYVLNETPEDGQTEKDLSAIRKILQRIHDRTPKAKAPSFIVALSIEREEEGMARQVIMGQGYRLKDLVNVVESRISEEPDGPIPIS